MMNTAIYRHHNRGEFLNESLVTFILKCTIPSNSTVGTQPLAEKNTKVQTSFETSGFSALCGFGFELGGRHSFHKLNRSHVQRAVALAK